MDKLLFNVILEDPQTPGEYYARYLDTTYIQLVKDQQGNDTPKILKHPADGKIVKVNGWGYFAV